MPGRVRIREGFNIWPGFVDALTTLLIMLLFVLTVFTAMQLFLGNILVGRDKHISELSQKMQALAQSLSVERSRLQASEKALEGLRAQLRTAVAERRRVEQEKALVTQRLAATEQQRQAVEGERDKALKRISNLDREKAELLARIVSLDRLRSQEKQTAEEEKTKLTQQATQLASDKTNLQQVVAQLEQRIAALEEATRAAEKTQEQLTSDKTTLEQRILALEARRQTEQGTREQLATEKQTLAQRVATLEKELTALRDQNEALQRERDRLQAAMLTQKQTATDKDKLTDKQAAQIVALNRQMAALRQQLAAIQEALQTSEAKGKSQTLEIADLGRKLNAALAAKVQQLQRYRSEFFGRLREVLGNRSDIRVVGDRFVFQSEVLFPVGSADINPAGREQLAKLAGSLKQIAAEIPKGLNWVLRVDGHTDKRPISSDRFPSNWELSSARAIAVVRFLVSEGIPPNRLVAAGFGQYQPIEDGDSEEAYARNRRIEFKLTER